MRTKTFASQSITDILYDFANIEFVVSSLLPLWRDSGLPWSPSSVERCFCWGNKDSSNDGPQKLHEF